MAAAYRVGCARRGLSARTGVCSPSVTERKPGSDGPLALPAPLPTGRTTASGLLLPDLSLTAARLGLVPVRDAWLDAAVRAYLTAGDYLPLYEQLRGNTFQSSAWADALLRLHPREVYVQALAALNRVARQTQEMLKIQDRFLSRLAPGLRTVIATALNGGIDGQPRSLLARQPVLRAMRLALTARIPETDHDERVASFLTGVDPETAAIMLVHLAADSLRQAAQPSGEPKLGGLPQSLAMEFVCNQIFNEPHDIGSALSRTWALWTRHGAQAHREQLKKKPLELLEEAVGLKLPEVLASAFAYWTMAMQDRISGPVRINAFAHLKLPPERVEQFLGLFSTTFEQLSADLEACKEPWQMLPLQTRPLLRIGDEVVVLDEPMLWEAVTTGLYWRVFDHVQSEGRTAWEMWTRAYAEMVETLAEELIEAAAPTLLGGSRALFAEEDITAAFATKKHMPPSVDAGIDFGDGVTLFEVVNKAMSLDARTGDAEAFKRDVEQAVFKKAKQLDGTAGLLMRNPQPAASPLGKPTHKVFPIIVCGNHFPLSPVTRNHVEGSLRVAGILSGPGIQPVAIIDLDDLEALASLAKAGHHLPQVLHDWLSGPYAKGSFTVYMWATYGGSQLERPAVVGSSFQDALDSILPLLAVADETRENGEEVSAAPE